MLYCNENDSWIHGRLYISPVSFNINTKLIIVTKEEFILHELIVVDEKEEVRKGILEKIQ